MKISFILTMQGAVWGGSEELWHQTAIYAAKAGANVSAHVYTSLRNHPKIKECINSNIKVSYRKSSPDILGKMLHKMVGNDIRQSKYWKAVLSENADLYVISQGDSYDALNVPALTTLLLTSNTRYALICQLNYEHQCLHNNNLNMARLLYAKAQKVYFVAQRNLETSERQLAQKIANGEVVFNPVKVSTDTPLAFAEADQMNIACVARLDCNFKGQDILLQVLSQQKWLERRFVLNLYGNGPDKSYLEDLIIFYKLKDKVIFKGHVENVEEIWRLNSCLVLSSFFEGTPLSLIEAMACGRPAVVTDVGGNSNWVQDGFNGYIAKNPTVADLDSALENLWQNQHQLQVMGQRSFAKYHQKFPTHPVKYFFERISEVVSAN